MASVEEAVVLAASTMITVRVEVAVRPFWPVAT
jgi:hypothetical protein